MPLRRPILALAAGGLILAGLGLHAWTIEPGRASGFANRALAGYGLAMTVEGPATLRFLPVPRLAFARTRIAASHDGPVIADGGGLTIDLDPRRLVLGEAGLAGVSLDGARLAPEAEAWTGPLARLRERLDVGGGGAGRIGLTRARLGDGGEVRDLDLDLVWPFWSAAAEAHARLTWRDVPVRIALTRLRPADVEGGRSSPFTAEVTWPGGSLAADGTLGAGAAGDLPSLAGRARFETRSLPETLAWLDRAAPLSPLAGPFSLEGAFEATRRGVSWPALRVGAGDNLMEGAASLALGPVEAPRLSVQATLAAGSLNLSPLLAALVRLFEPEPVPLALAPLTRGDLDLRLSAAAGRFGPIQVEDLAASVLVRDSAIEVAINRARVKDGIVKGRVALASGADPAETEVRAQGSLDSLDLGGLMGDIGEPRWVLGPMQGQFALESSARDTAGLLARVAGRASLAIEGGAIAGLDLADVIHRNGTVAQGALARRNGRTGFERAAVALRFADGVGAITDASLRGPGIGAILRGQVSLPEQRLEARAELSHRPPGDPSRGLVFEISGPWSALTARGVRGEAADPAARPPGEAAAPGPFNPASLGLPGTARAYAP